MIAGRVQDFLADTGGAVTVDWVALTSAMLLLGLMVVYSIFNNSVSSLVVKINSTLNEVDLARSIGTLDNLSGTRRRRESDDH